MTDPDAQKRAAGEAAAALVQSGMVVGLGTGSTAAWFVRALAARKLDITGVPTSQATADLAASLGIRIGELGETKGIDLTVDGADEIGPGLALIKGGGAALLREKLVWEASKSCVVIADAAKQVKTLGKFPLPIEVVAFGHKTTAGGSGTSWRNTKLASDRCFAKGRGAGTNRRRKPYL
jgi:ribose 5-phosphate isomerase A